MGFFDEVKGALGEIFGEFGQPVKWRDKEYNCTIAEGHQSVELESGGFVPDETFTVKFLEKDLDGERPLIGEIFEINSCLFRIEWVSSRANRGQVEVSLAPKDR
jgi:hypothetical protein